jgi:hypothetical protein
MGYQYIENLKNGRELIIREYEDMNIASLPDERYQVKLKYYDNSKLIEEQKAYDVQLKSFEIEVAHLWDVIEEVYKDKKRFKGVTDFDDLNKTFKSRIAKEKTKSGAAIYEHLEKPWDEISFVKAAETTLEEMNKTYIYEKDKIKRKFVIMKKKIHDLYGYQYPVVRRVLEERLLKLESQYDEFDYLINPYHIQPGLLLDLDITSIKRKKATLDGMANVLNEFLYGVSKGFQDAAFASFSRRRSTVRADLGQSFEAGSDSGDENKGQSYLDLLNSTMTDEAPTQALAAPAQNKPAGIVDTSKRKPGPQKKSGPQRKPRSPNKLKNI